jgi:hypothetical protein
MHGEFMFQTHEWDQMVILRLYRRFEHILWAHKIKLKPVAIRLMESKTHWGRWDSENRTIWISRNLIVDNPWYCVEGILRHEMAHQYCHEVLLAHERPHGERFKVACERLGVPQEFRGATVNLQETVLDWKTQKQDEESEKLFSKVQKLLALATSSNEHEALLAMNKVREIYAKYNLDKYCHGDQEQSKSNMAHIFLSHKKKRIEAHQDKIAGILVGHFFVKVIFSRDFDAKTLQEYKSIELIGTRENVLMAEYVYYFLLQQTEFLVRELKKKKTTLSRLEAKSYRLGVLQGFSEKLLRMDEQMKKSSTSLAPISHASGKDGLVTFEKALAALESDKSLSDYLNTVYPRLVNASGQTQYLDSSIYGEGRAAGRQINLHKAVADKKGNTGLLLS